MTTSDLVKELCKRQNISLAEVARRIAFTMPDGEKIRVDERGNCRD